ncbi:MAG: phosphatidylserine decarboxylase [Opitutaceae bacterium]|nr:phosphatidylserine decarboxylase [Opitutaceae bacterium]
MNNPRTLGLVTQNPTPITYFNRYTGEEETEPVYGEKWLRWVYETGIGQGFLHSVVKRSLFSRFYGWRMDRAASRSKVAPFIESYGLDVADFADAPDSYKTFNEFFIRKLKESARPISTEHDVAVFPADGRHLGFQDISKTQGVYAKGQRFDLDTFLGDAALAKRYSDGAMVISRLCPVDYHRYHFTCEGVPSEPRLINGPLFSVNPIALRRDLRYLFENKRMLCSLQSELFGQVLCLEIGATCVGSIVQTYEPERKVEKGAEKGMFRFGGSCTILLFEQGRIELAADLCEQTEKSTEVFARMGDTLGKALS